MSDEIHIRTVQVELLRAGPAHNQLLSPLTPYLGICDDAEAGIVTMPYEQHTFVRRMRAMRYDGEDDKGKKSAQKDKLPDLRDLGVEMARVLGSIPRLPGSLAADPRGQDTLVHLSLVLSASELAGLPFELAKVPIGPNAWTENWLALQARVPVVITRRTRNVSPYGFKWLHEPRILFVAADPDPEADSPVPFFEHRAALIDAVRPFLMSDDLDGDGHSVEPPLKANQTLETRKTPQNQRECFGNLLTILSNASFEAVVRECARVPYSHVHILAHGSQDDSYGDLSHGLALRDKDGVISGDRLASALACMVGGALHRPQVVTLATCDSGNMDDVVHPGASVAHVLHQAGIPLVLASQVPLGFEGSVLLAREFYGGLLWGEHPWKLLHRVRSSLHGQLNPRRHDWASLVVYESLPSDMSRQLEAARFRQCQTALAVAFATVSDSAIDPVQAVIDKLDLKGPYYGMESLALRADGRLRLAYEPFSYAVEVLSGKRGGYGNSLGDFNNSLLDSCWWLEQALIDYEQAVDGFLVTPGQGMNAPYRTLVAQFSIRLVLGKPIEWGMWHMARYWVERTIEQSPDPEPKVWALGSLAELWLLRQMDPNAGLQPDDMDRRATAALREMLRLTDRSLARGGSARDWISERIEWYVSWWGHHDLQAVIRKCTDMGADDGLYSPFTLGGAFAETARHLLDVVDKAAPNGDHLDEAPDPPPKNPKPTKPSKPSKAKPSAAAAQPHASTALSTPAAPADPTQAPDLLGAPRPGASAKTPAQGTVFDIEMLAAGHGDALWIEYGVAGQPVRRVLVDCGIGHSYAKALRPRIEQLPKAPARHFELFVMSHIDADHIGGAIPFLEDIDELGVSFGDIWFNGRKHLVSALGVKQGDDFSKQLRARKLPWNLWRKGKAIVRGDDELPSLTLAGGMKLTLLSPLQEQLLALADEWDAELGEPKPSDLMKRGDAETSEDVVELAGRAFKNDTSKPNGSSIALLAEFQGKRVLLGADAYAPVLESALNLLRGTGRMKLDAFKLPHHGSKNNLRRQLLEMVDCQHYLVSTSGATFHHPDRQAIAQVIEFSRNQPTLHFNFRSKDNALWGDAALQKKYHGYQTQYPPDGQAGLKFSLF